MSIALIMPERDAAGLRDALVEELPEVSVWIWPDVDDLESVDFAVLWQPPAGVVATMPGLRAVTSFGAGVDGLLDEEIVPLSIPIGRIVDSDLPRQMSAYLLAHVLDRVCEFSHYRRRQREQRWAPRLEPRGARVGLLGLGQMGRHVANLFVDLGFEVRAWCRTPRSAVGIEVINGNKGWQQVASQAEYLICLLPLTADTKGLLSRPLFELMPAGSSLIHVGRGAQLVEEDLLAALDRGRPAWARLDVFDQEPLPPGHRFWHHPRIEVTPHVAAITSMIGAAGRIADSYRLVMSGGDPLDAVDRRRGY